MVSVATLSFLTLMGTFPGEGFSLAQNTLSTPMAEEAKDGAGNRFMDTLRRDLVAADGSRKIADEILDLKRQIVDLKTSLGINQDNPGVVKEIEAEIETLNQEIKKLIGQEIFGTLNQPLNARVLERAKYTEKKVVYAWDIAYFLANPGAYANYWRLVRQDPDFGKVGKSGIIAVLLPYAIGSPELSGINSKNLPEALKVLNAFAKKYTGEDVDLTLSDFGYAVGAESLGEVERTLAEIEKETGYLPTRLFARRKVAEAFSQVMEPLVAIVFDLPFQDGVGMDTMEKALVAAIEKGREFINQEIFDVSEEARNALLELRNHKTFF